jgi:predicted nucleic acid-binding Zn ribbon protein
LTIYEFSCTAAQHSIEEFHALGKAPDAITCDEHNSPARRLLSRGAFNAVPGGYAATHR